MSHDHEFSIGDVVLDSHQESATPAVVVNQPPKRADEWTAYTNTTVAEDNPEYPDDFPIVIVAFYDDLSEHAEELLWPDSPIPVNQLHEHDVKDYAFPVDRLRPADDPSLAAQHAEEAQETTEATDEIEPAPTSDADGQDEDESALEADEGSSANDDGGEQEHNHNHQHDLHDLRDYLTDNGIQAEIDAESVVVEKLGQTYRLSPNEGVDGDGPHRDRLEQLFTEAPV